MGLSKRKATTKSSLSKQYFDDVCKLFLNDVLSVVVMEDILPSLIINWDQTGTISSQLPSGQWRSKGHTG